MKQFADPAEVKSTSCSSCRYGAAEVCSNFSKFDYPQIAGGGIDRRAEVEPGCVVSGR
jgi:hypothetical protein